MNFDLGDLRAFAAVADLGSFKAAAEALHLSQPAFSALIQGVEQSLGAKLFERSTRSVVLTPEGALFEASARRVLADFDGMVDDFRAHAERRRGRVAVAALPSLAATVVPAVFARLAVEHPGLRLDLLDTLSGASFDLVRAGEADFALTAENPDYAEARRIRPTSVVTAMPSGARAAGSAPVNQPERRHSGSSRLRACGGTSSSIAARWRRSGRSMVTYATWPRWRAW